MKELIYNDIVVRCDSDAQTVWLSQKQMAELYGRERSVITKHLQDAVETGEIERNSVCAKYAHTATDGKTYEVEHYNLDAILAVGYRVKSPVGTHFRKWATRQLREILLGRQVNDREQRLWAAYEKEPSARCRAQLLRLMGAVCEPAMRTFPVQSLPSASRVSLLEPVAPGEFWRLLQAHWDELRPDEWLRAADSEWCLDRSVVVARLRAVAAGARRWSVRSVGAGLRAFGVTVGRRYFPGRSGGQFCWCVPVASVPSALREKPVAAQVL